jgi:hypothetical protein
MRRIVIGLVVMGLMLGTPGLHRALAQPLAGEASAEMGPAASFGWGMAAVGTNLLYIPAKLVYALGGSLTGLLAWGLSAGNNDVAMGVLQPALGGTWVVTPEMLRGEVPLMYNGPSWEPPHRS